MNSLQRECIAMIWQKNACMQPDFLGWNLTQLSNNILKGLAGTMLAVTTDSKMPVRQFTFEQSFSHTLGGNPMNQ